MTDSFLPYGRQQIDQDDIDAVVDTLKSSWLTTGPNVSSFEKAFCEFVGSHHAVAVSSGTAALHAAVYALGIGPGDEVIVPAMTFAATANAVLFQQGKVVFADVNADTLLIDPADVEAKVTPRTKAVIAVDYAGQPCDYDSLRRIADRHALRIISDACHSLGATYHGKPAAGFADLAVFSFHPVKHVTTGEGGMIATNDAELDRRMRVFRNHGITTDARQREEVGTWFYEMHDLGFNYRLTDIQCALGLSQLKKQPQWLNRRKEIAREYDRALETLNWVRPLKKTPGGDHAYHLYVVRINEKADVNRAQVFSKLRDQGIGVNVHYIPVHLHPYYREKHGTHRGQCPVAESAYEQVLSLPIFPAMNSRDVRRVALAFEAIEV